jgi:stage II sporulation protein Q
MEQLPRKTRNRFLFPAIYLIAAAALISIFWLVQNNRFPGDLATNVNLTSSASPASDAVTTTATQDEVLHWPVSDPNAIQVVTPYYSETASAEDKAAAMLQFGDSFVPSAGISIARKDGATFDVLAAKTGVVTRIETLPMLGQVVEVTHANKQKTVYDSLDSVNVKLDDKVTQGSVIGQAGRNELEKDRGVHVHFEVYNSGSPVNPTALLSPTLTETTSASPAVDTP